VISAVVGLFWVIILSKMRGELEDKPCVDGQEGGKFAAEQLEMICSDKPAKPIPVDTA